MQNKLNDSSATMTAFVLLGATIILSLSFQPRANAQGDIRGSVSVLTCSSNDGKRVYCDADTRGGVRLSRQVSGSPCTQGSTWGYDARGIWVDRGCRAEFEIASGPVGRGASTLLTCSSNDGRRVYCDADTRGGVRMVRQVSGSACTEGSTWGYDARGIWVDRGCRADFEIGSVDNRGDRDRGDRDRYDRDRGDRDARPVASTVSVDPYDNVVWQASARGSRVFVQVDGEREKLFAEGSSGSQAPT